jgi:hypothetical protein
MDSNNAVIGDSGAVELPQTEVNDEAITELRKRARFSKTKEFKELRDALDERIVFYQTFLPNGNLTSQASKQQAAENWRLANIVISELQAVKNAYDGSIELLKELDEQV